MNRRDHITANATGTATAHQVGWPESREHGNFCSAPFPVLASTHLCMELFSQQSAVDLRATAELLRRDPGAVLRTFAAIADEIHNPHARPERLEDCIASLGTSRLLRALGAPSCSWEEQARLAAFARHALTIARLCRLAASSLGVCQERAYLVGLLHSVGSLPIELGRTLPSTVDENEATALSIVRQHHLPAALRHALETVYRNDPGSLWVALIQAAHELSSTRQARA